MMSRRLTTLEVITNFKAKHGDRYDYSEVNYVNMKTKIKILCKDHGYFLQNPDNHQRGFNCPNCGDSKRGTWNTDIFCKKANVKHNDKYLYNKVKYVNTDTKVIITCPIHGDFMQRPNDHMQGKGCIKCGVAVSANSKKTSLERFIKLANEKHNNTYDYSKVKYIRSIDKVKIVCGKHGVFYKSPGSHLHGQGCPSCIHRGFNPQKIAMLYYLKINDGEAYKIGITNKTVNERFNTCDLKNIEIIKTWKYEIGYDAAIEEQRILKEFKYARYQGAPLLDSGNSELFHSDILLLDVM